MRQHEANQLRPFSQKLRREMTRQERHLWYDFLRNMPVRFYRQKIIGPYIVDFCCPRARLVVELDGSQHYEAEGKREDIERDAYMREEGFEVLRFSNADVDQRFEAVCERILQTVQGKIGE